MSYLPENGACSRACGHFFMGWMPNNNKLIRWNRAFHTNSMIMRFVVASAAAAELGALFHNCQIGIIFDKHWTTLVTINPKHPPTLIMQWQLASQIIRLSTNDQDLWKWDFVGRRQSCPGYVRSQLSPQNGKSCWLLEWASCGVPPCCY